MSALPKTQTTSLATSTAQDVYIRDQSLCSDLMGQVTFTEMAYFLILGVRPTPAQCAIVDACLVTLMEHGLTPSALAARLTYTSAKEAMQGAVAAGLLGVGSLFVGTMEGCALLLDRIIAGGEPLDAEARRVALEHQQAGRPLPGFGHPLHKPDDPRSKRLLELVEHQKLTSNYTRALEALSRAVDDVFQKHITINATGAVAAALGDAGVPPAIMRGFALISRCAGLVAHIREEQEKPALRAIWEASERAVAYDGKAGQ